MKKFTSIICALIATMAVQAQQTLHICDGFKSTPLTLGTNDGITFSEDYKKLLAGDFSYSMSDIDSITVDEPVFRKVTITYSGSEATVDVPSFVKGLSVNVSGANVSIINTNTTDEVLYYVSGKSSNGSLSITGEYKLTLALAGLTLTSTSNKAPIDIECGKRIGVILVDGTTNTITDAASNTAKGAFYTSGHAEFEGGGTLNITGKAKHALCVKEYLQFKKSTGTINILGAASDGIHCGKGKVNDDNSHLQINGGDITVSNAGSDCIDCDDYGCAFIKGGKLTLNVSQAEGTGLKVDSCIYMTDGDITINVTGNISEGIRATYAAYFDGGKITETVAGNGSRGIRSKKTTKTTDKVLNGGYMEFNGTTADITVTGGVNASDNTVCYGIKADTQFKQTAGTITITVNSSDSSTKAYNFKSDVSTGGTLSVK